MKLWKFAKAVLMASTALVSMTGAAVADPISITLLTAVGVNSALIGGPLLAATTAALQVAGGLALNFGLSLLSGALTKKPKGIGGASTNVQFGADVPRQILFGRGVTAGRLVYFKGVGKKNGDVHAVYALSDWQCEELESVWIGGEEKSLTPVSVVGTEDARYTVDGYNGAIIIKWFSGAFAQTADSELVTASGSAGQSIGSWTANHRLAGMCYVSIIFSHDQEDLPAIPSLLFQIKGAKLYDLRLDSTNGGSGSHRFDDPTTWEWSANPAICDYCFRRGFFRGTYRVLGMGIASYDLLNDHYVTAANICDETVSDGGGNRNRYEVGVIVNDDAEFRVAVDAFKTAMAADIVEKAGLFGPIAGAAYAPVMTITDDDMREGAGSSFQRKTSRSNLYNGVAASYLNPTLKWEADSLIPLLDSDYETEDGGERLVKDVDFPMVYNAYQARALATIIHNQSRFQAVHTGIYPARFSALEPGDWVTRTFNRDTGYGSSELLDAEIYGVDMDFLTGNYLYRNGPDEYVMKVISTREVDAEWYEITMQQAETAGYTGPTGTITLPSAPTITLPDLDPDAPSGLSATGLPGAVLLKWTNPSADTFDQIEVWEAATNDRTGATLLGTQRSTSLLRSPLDAGTTRYYWIRALDTASRPSAWHPTGSTSGVSGKATAIIPKDTGVYPVVASLPTLPDVAYPSGTIVELDPPGELYVNIADVWTPATDQIVVNELSALTGKMGTLVAGVIESPNYVPDTSGFRIDADTGAIEAMDIRVAGGTSTTFPFETAFGTYQDGLLSDEGAASVDLVYSGIYTTISGVARRTPTGVEYNIQGVYENGAQIGENFIQGTFPRAKGFTWAPASKIIHSFQNGGTNTIAVQIVITSAGVIEHWQTTRVNGGSWSCVRTELGRFLNTTDLDPMFESAYNQTTIHVWKNVLVKGIRRIRVPETVLVAGTPTPVVGMTVWAWGAAGQVGYKGSRGGPGGYTKASHAVTPGEMLSLLVGAYEGDGFGGNSVPGLDHGSEITTMDLYNHGGGGSFIWRGKTLRSNLLQVAGGGGSGSNGIGGVGGSVSFGGGNGSSSTDMDRCIGVSLYDAAYTDGRGSGGGGYEGGGVLSGGTSPGKGGTNFIIGSATSTTNSASAEGGSGNSTTTTPPGTGEAAYTANQTYDQGRADVGTASTTAEKAGPGMICIQWLT